jgi:hypothetical protein
VIELVSSINIVLPLSHITCHPDSGHGNYGGAEKVWCKGNNEKEIDVHWEVRRTGNLGKTIEI